MRVSKQGFESIDVQSGARTHFTRWVADFLDGWFPIAMCDTWREAMDAAWRHIGSDGGR
jgi:hypothetical protein